MNQRNVVTFISSVLFAIALLPGCGHGSCQAPAPATAPAPAPAAPAAPATTAPPNAPATK